RIWRVLLAWFLAISVIGLSLQLFMGIFSGVRNKAEDLKENTVPVMTEDSLTIELDTLEN
ncbi:MAG: hypothetical protein AAGA62_03350, partial [Bacteroidota bacterium]